MPSLRFLAFFVRVLACTSYSKGLKAFRKAICFKIRPFSTVDCFGNGFPTETVFFMFCVYTYASTPTPMYTHAYIRMVYDICVFQGYSRSWALLGGPPALVGLPCLGSVCFMKEQSLGGGRRLHNPAGVAEQCESTPLAPIEAASSR